MTRTMLSVFGAHLSAHMLLYVAIGAEAPQSMLSTYRHAGGTSATIGVAVLAVLALAALVDAVCSLCVKARLWLPHKARVALWCAIACAQASQAVVVLLHGLPWPLVATFVWMALGALSIAGMHSIDRAVRWHREAGRWSGLH